MTMANASNLFEIQSSELALNRSRSAAVKDFATRMVTDHRNAAAKFKAALNQAKLPMPPDELDARQRAMLDNLKGADASAFDATYINAQNKAHIEAVNLFDSYSKNGDNPRLKAYAADVLPTLRGHLEHVQKLK
jgi:putative membrane protein